VDECVRGVGANPEPRYHCFGGFPQWRITLRSLGAYAAKCFGAQGRRRVFFVEVPRAKPVGLHEEFFMSDDRPEREKKGVLTLPSIDHLIKVLEKVWQQRPLVHAITNWVNAGDVANGLYAIKARPVMTVAEEEVKEVVSKADALMLNLGTPSPERVASMIIAGQRAQARGIPIVLDPVGAGLSHFRTTALNRLLAELTFSVIKGNQAEIGILAGAGGELRGVDAVAGPEDPETAAKELAKKTKAIVVVTGERDLVLDEGHRVVLDNGHPLMSYMTGTGCMLAAMIAAFVACERDVFLAAVAAVAGFGIAGEQAAKKAIGPGTFKVAFLDSLYSLTPEQIASGIRMM
jgi:hydroxyethylthiazole kinase